MNNFTFSPKNTKQSEIEYDSWAEKIKVQHNPFGKESNVKYGAWTRKNRGTNKEEDDDDANSTPSPELWEKDTPIRNNKYCYNGIMKHNSDTITKYRKEMLDMVRGMPETAYELSLRDIVESPSMLTPLREASVTDDKTERKILRSESLDSGGLNMRKFIPRIPSFLGLNHKKSKGKNGSIGAKVSPKPMLGDGDKSGSEKSADREWWNEDSDSRGSSNSSGRRKNRRKFSGCYPLFQTRF